MRAEEIAKAAVAARDKWRCCPSMTCCFGSYEALGLERTPRRRAAYETVRAGESDRRTVLLQRKYEKL